MKIHLLLLSLLISSAIGRERLVSFSCASTKQACALNVEVLQAGKSTKQTPPAAPCPPTSKPAGRERGARPTLPAHLFM
jgi:hypothetical protein